MPTSGAAWPAIDVKPNRRLRGAAATGRAVRRRILVVDDEQTTRDSVAATLERHGYSVCTAVDAFQGLWVMRQRPVELLIARAGMAVCSGRELARRVRELWPRMPILLVLDSPASADSDQPPPEEEWAVLRRPFSLTAVTDEVDGLLARAGGRERPFQPVRRHRRRELHRDSKRL